MESYIVHIYRQGGQPDSENTDVIGMVEGIESEKHYAFTNPNELWDILAGKYLERFSGKKNLTTKKGGWRDD
ncbi:hypothetical protein BMS3Abin06_01674 [bacterium BMS3Abin06]|nr:hypothetical protein BMS3Abin06_01674 [bacterium BMS3Abin06]